MEKKNAIRYNINEIRNHETQAPQKTTITTIDNSLYICIYIYNPSVSIQKYEVKKLSFMRKISLNFSSALTSWQILAFNAQFE